MGAMGCGLLRKATDPPSSLRRVAGFQESADAHSEQPIASTKERSPGIVLLGRDPGAEVW